MTCFLLSELPWQQLGLSQSLRARPPEPPRTRGDAAVLVSPPSPSPSSCFLAAVYPLSLELWREL